MFRIFIISYHTYTTRFLEQALSMEHDVYSECNDQHLSLVKTYGELARVSFIQGKTQEAHDNVNKGLEMVQEILPQCLSHARLLFIKGEIEVKNNMNNSEKHFNEALEIYKINLGQESRHQGIPLILTSLAAILLQKNDLVKALETITESLFLFKQIYGSIKHPNQAHALETQGMIFAKQGKFDLAKESFQAALDILHDVFGEDHEHEVIRRVKVSFQNLQNIKSKKKHPIVSLKEMPHVLGHAK